MMSCLIGVSLMEFFECLVTYIDDYTEKGVSTEKFLTIGQNYSDAAARLEEKFGSNLLDFRIMYNGENDVMNLENHSFCDFGDY